MRRRDLLAEAEARLLVSYMPLDQAFKLSQASLLYYQAIIRKRVLSLFIGARALLRDIEKCCAKRVKAKS